MKTYRWSEPAPNGHYHESLECHNKWLSEHFGPRTWFGIGYPVKQLFQAEREAWQIIHAAMSKVAPDVLRSPQLKRIVMYEGEQWRLFVAAWSLNTPFLAHTANYWLQAETDTELLQFKLACL